jgi:uncharacterized membrane protein
MTKSVKIWNDERMRFIMGTLLRAGVLIAAFLVILGGILFFIQHPSETYNFTSFKGEPDRLKHVGQILREALQFKSRAVIQLGLLVLIATPVARVIFSLIGFLFEKDWIYVAITSLVLCILCYSIFFS